MVNLTPEDLARRKDLNEQRNPRKEIPNEATSNINPLTGKPYDIDFQLYLELGHGLYKNKYIAGNTILGYGNIENIEPIEPQISDFMEYQLALARKNVRDGKMGKIDYMRTKQRVQDLVSRMNRAGVPLEVINTPTGLDAALSDAEMKEFMNTVLDKSPYNPYNISNKYLDLLMTPTYKKDLLGRYKQN